MTERCHITEQLRLADNTAKRNGVAYALVRIDERTVVRPLLDAIGFPILEVVRAPQWHENA